MENRLQLTQVRTERQLQIPLFSQKQEAAANETAVEVLDPAESERLMITRYGQEEEITFSALMLDPQIRLRNELLQNGKRMELIYEEPIREGEKWAAFPVHDGFHVVVVPKDDLLSGNTSRKAVHRAVPVEKAPAAMLYTKKNDVVMDLRSGEKSICDGQSVIDMLKTPAPAKEKESLINLARNIEKNAGAGALLPPAPTKRNGR